MADEPGGCLECGHGPCDHLVEPGGQSPCEECDCKDYVCPSFVAGRESRCLRCLKEHGPNSQPSSDAALVHFAREACGCMGCSGAREIGAHTIAAPNSPRMTPTTCLAPTLLKHYLKERDRLIIQSLRKERERG